MAEEERVRLREPAGVEPDENDEHDSESLSVHDSSINSEETYESDDSLPSISSLDSYHSDSDEEYSLCTKSLLTKRSCVGADCECIVNPEYTQYGKLIMEGDEFQAVVPNGLSKYDDVLPYENVDTLLWNPSILTPEEVQEYLTNVEEAIEKAANKNAINQPVKKQRKVYKDDEEALYSLLQCGFNTEEALRRRSLNVIPPTDTMSLWSDEECNNFESGLKAYGKNFYLIQKNKVRTRSVGELVHFYYLYKKTERHDMFISRTRLGKRKYNLEASITDFMERFINETDNEDKQAGTSDDGTKCQRCSIDSPGGSSQNGQGDESPKVKRSGYLQVQHARSRIRNRQ